VDRRRDEEIGEAMIVIRVLHSSRWLPAVLLALALLFTPAQSGGGQTLAPTPSVSGHTPAQVMPRAYMPLIVALPQVEIQFGTGLDSQNNLLDPGTIFVYGIAELYYRYTVRGKSDQLYRTEWFVDSVRQPQLDDSGPILSDSAVFTNFFCSPTLGSCGQPVPRGVYRVRFYIDDVFYHEATAVVQ
jgi:hypothetical protein